MTTVPELISVDDHVFEPPDLWTSRLPAKWTERGPRIERRKLARAGRGKGGGFDQWIESEDGRWCDVWLYDGLEMPLMQAFAAVGGKAKGFDCITFDDIVPGAWQQKARLADMDINHTEAALCFPNTLPRFCGQTFYEGADHELGLACVRAYNDWLYEDWGAGDAKGRLIGAGILPLWDPALAGDEIRRCAAMGSVAVTFPESPHPLGLPSFHTKDGHWDPIFAACQETGTVLCMHIGSSSKMPTTSPDAPFMVTSALTSQNAMGSLVDFIFSRTLERFAQLKISYSEAQVGWMPFLLERCDKIYEHFHSGLSQRPSDYVKDRVYGCIFDDETGLRMRDAIGIDQICFETDYPHADSTFPDSQKVLAELAERTGLTDEEVYKVARGNAIKGFDLARVGISR